MTSAAQLGGFIELDAVIGWQATLTRLSPIPPTGLAVDCVTGQPLPFLPSLPDQPGFPIALAHHEGHLYLLDDAVDRVKSIDLQQQTQYHTIKGFGGKGRDARELRQPRGLAVLSDGAYVIADTGNHQVKTFSCFPHALLSVWGSGGPGAGLGEFNCPTKVVADRCGLIYVADRGNGRVQRMRRDGISEDPIVGLDHPFALALSSDGTLVVLDRAGVQVYAPAQLTPAQTFVVPGASCITLDDSGYLYVGTNTALIYKYASTAGADYRAVGIGVTGVSGRILDLLWTSELQLVGILLEKCAARPVLMTLSTCGSYLPDGSVMTNTLDSGIENCVWDRIHLNASIPRGTVIEVSTQTATTDIWAGGSAYQAECSAYSADVQNCTLVMSGENTDCLVQSNPGRYLRVQLTMKTSGVASPSLRSAQISFPRASYLQYLPAVYQQDDRSRRFLDRFLRIFQTTFDGMDRALDQLWMRFDPLSVPDSWFSWLAAWLALPINPLWTDQQRRAALKSAGTLYPKRGTPAGVQQLASQFSGVSMRLIEHYRLRQLIILSHGQASSQALGSATRLWSRDYYRRLQVGVYSRVGYFNLTGEPEPDIEPLAWGSNEFTVFYDCDPYQVTDTQKKVTQAVEQEKPAYTKANYAAVYPRMRVGVQSTLGVDTRIGEYTPLLLGSTGTLDYDSILSGTKTDNRLQAQDTSLRPQIDVNSRLL